MSTLIKICGITSVEDALLAVEAGASFVGVIFVPGSPRCVDFVTGARISDEVHEAGARLVAVFRDMAIDEVNAVAAAVDADFVQLHGSETEDDVRLSSRPVIKAVPVSEANIAPRIEGAAWDLYDTASILGGGSGLAFDWSLLREAGGAEAPRPFFVAGGLTPDNVAEAIRVTGCHGVDVSSGVESSPGVKSPERIRAFVEAVRSIDVERAND